MPENSHEHIVNFVYCRFCEYRETREEDEPCADCLENSVNVDSRRPIHFKDSGSLARINNRWGKKENTK